jgi:uracil phosphoribosyltransferase
MVTLPKNAHVSTHPCLKAKLSLLRSASTSSRDVSTLVHDIALMVGYEALASGLKAQDGATVCPVLSFASLDFFKSMVPRSLPKEPPHLSCTPLYAALLCPTHNTDTTHAMSIHIIFGHADTPL